MYKTSISKEEINELPLMEWDGEIIEVVTPHGARRAFELLAGERVVGFDTETRPSYTKGVVHTPALLQVSTLNQAFIFRLKFYPLPPELIDFLESETTLKVGVGIQDDLHGLNKIAKFKPKGFVDLTKEAKLKGCQEGSLRALTAIYLGTRLSKAAKLTNWERHDLTPQQLSYAAIDAAVGLMIYHKLFPN